MVPNKYLSNLLFAEDTFSRTGNNIKSSSSSLLQEPIDFNNEAALFLSDLSVRQAALLSYSDELVNRRLLLLNSPHLSMQKDSAIGHPGFANKNVPPAINFQPIPTIATASLFGTPIDPVRTSNFQPTIEKAAKKFLSKNDTKWLATLEELKQYKEKNGDCIVPRGFSENPRLASWVSEQRKQYKLLQDGKPSNITLERVQLLEEVGFVWNAQEAAWDKHFNALRQFLGEYGHCHVPLNHAKYPKLGLWVKEQRRHYSLLKQDKPSHINEERIALLSALGFCWDTHEAIWLERFRELSEFKERFGTCLVPTSCTIYPKLATWVHHQRRQYKKFMQGKPGCHITKARIESLESIGFIWRVRKRDSPIVDDSSSVETEVELEERPEKRQRL